MAKQPGSQSVGGDRTVVGPAASSVPVLATANGEAAPVLRPLRTSRDGPSYDVREPLAAIATLADAALNAPAAGPVGRDAVEQISAIARSLLDLCRAVGSAGRPHPVSVAAVAAPVVNDCAAATGCSIELDARRLVVTADATALGMALWSLLDIACAAAGRQGRVRVAARRDGRRVAIEITDSGSPVGADPPPPPSIGLDVIAPLARRQGWELQVDRHASGGTTLRLLLPSEHDDSAIAGVVVCGETRLGGAAVAAALERRHVPVLDVQQDVRRCIDAVRIHQPALCILSDALSASDAEMLVAELRHVSANTRAVLVSSDGLPVLVNQSREGVLTAIVAAEDGLEHMAAVVERCIHDGAPAGQLRPDRGKGADGSLTQREYQVLRLLAHGEDTAALATELGITYTTARAHIQKVLMKLNVHSKLEAVSYAIREGIVSPPAR